MPHTGFLEGLPCYNKQNFRRYFDNSRPVSEISSSSASRTSIYTATNDYNDDGAIQIVTENSFDPTISYLSREERHLSVSNSQVGRLNRSQSNSTNHNRRRTSLNNSTTNNSTPMPSQSSRPTNDTNVIGLRTDLGPTQQHPSAVSTSTPVSTRKRKAGPRDSTEIGVSSTSTPVRTKDIFGEVISFNSTPTDDSRKDVSSAKRKKKTKTSPTDSSPSSGPSTSNTERTWPNGSESGDHTPTNTTRRSRSTFDTN